MTETQIYCAIGIPCFTMIVCLIVSIVDMARVRTKIEDLREDVKGLRDDILGFRSTFELVTRI